MQCAYCHLWSVRLYNIFPHYLINGTIFKKVNEYKICVLIFSKMFSETFLILRGNERNMIKNVYWSSCKVFVILIIFNGSLISSKYFWKILKTSNLKKTRPVEVHFILCGMTDRRTDMTKLIVAYRDFANAPKREQSFSDLKNKCQR